MKVRVDAAPRSAGLPARAALDAAGLRVALVDIPASELRDPFLQQTVDRVPGAQELWQRPLETLERTPTPAAPVGVIFHVARCGSTLVCEQLKRHGGAIVYAEPLAVNELLLPPAAVSRDVLAAALRAIGSLFAAHAQRPYVLKLSSWNTLVCDVVAQAFPETPWAFCLRDPLEVCVSLREQAPGWLRDEAAIGFGERIDSRWRERSADERSASVFAAFCDAALRLDIRRGLLVSYDALPAAAWQHLAPHFGLRVGAAEIDRMAAAAAFDSKSPVDRPTAFAPDDARKRQAATPALRHAVDAIARPAYRRVLERFARPTTRRSPD